MKSRPVLLGVNLGFIWEAHAEGFRECRMMVGWSNPALVLTFYYRERLTVHEEQALTIRMVRDSFGSVKGTVTYIIGPVNVLQMQAFIFLSNCADLKIYTVYIYQFFLLLVQFTYLKWAKVTQLRTFYYNLISLCWEWDYINHFCCIYFFSSRHFQGKC